MSGDRAGHRTDRRHSSAAATLRGAVATTSRSYCGSRSTPPLLGAESARELVWSELLSELLHLLIGSDRVAVDRVLKSLDHRLEVRDTCLQRAHTFIESS
jgi:hypothetical protein